jgi:hypothetical protein
MFYRELGAESIRRLASTGFVAAEDANEPFTWSPSLSNQQTAGKEVSMVYLPYNG